MDWFYAAGPEIVGPLTRNELTALFKTRKISSDTLVWNQAVGGAWKKLSVVDAEISEESRIPPPLPKAALEVGTDTILPWIIALLPFATLAIDRVIGDFVTKEAILVSSIASFGLYSLFVFLDISAINARCLNPQQRSLAWCIFFIPAYLFRRAVVLKQRFWYAGLWCVSFIASMAISSPDIFSSSAYWGVGIPSCTSASAKKMANDLGNQILNRAGANVVTLGTISELEYSDKVRTCSVAINSSNGATRSMKMTITPQGEQYYFKLQEN